MTTNWENARRGLSDGMHARRTSWRANTWVELVNDGEHTALVLLSDKDRSEATLTWEDLTATDWHVVKAPVVRRPFTNGELLLAAETGRTVYFRPPCDRLQQESFITIGEEQPGWKYVQVMLAVRRAG